MRVLLVNAGTYCVTQKAAIPLGLLSIATYLENNGHTVRIFDRAAEGGGIQKNLDSFSPEFVGVSVISLGSFPDAIEVSKAVKKSNIPVVWGGQMPSLIPEVALETGVVDFVVIGDGEIAMLELMNAVVDKTSFHDVDGLAYTENGEIVINKVRALADLSQFPVIDWKYVDPRKYFFANLTYTRLIHVYASKGCTGQCTFCYSPNLSKHLWRERPVEYCLAEIQYLIENFDIEGVYFADDLLSPNRDYLVRFCNKIIDSGLKFVWSCCMRADICCEEDLRLMHDAGCRWIHFGVESGSEKRQKLIKKRLNLEKVRETMDHCRGIGINSVTSFLIGYPDETDEELKETVQFMLNLNSDVKIPCLFVPIPKSELVDYLVSSGRIEAPQTYEDWKKFKFFDKLGINFSEVSCKDLKVVSSYFLYAIFALERGKDNKKAALWIKRLVEQYVFILKLRSLKALWLFFLGGIQFLEIVFYANMFPTIRKKYGLKNSSFEKKD